MRKGTSWDVELCICRPDALRRPIAGRRLVAALQPQQRLVDGSVLGLKALARWTHDGKWVPPAEFVSIAQDVGLAQP